VSSFKKAIIQLHVFVFLAGLTGPIGNYIQLNGLNLVFYRMGITSLIAVAIYLLSKKKDQTTRATKVKLLGIGVLIALHWVCFYSSIKLANVSIALVCFSSVGLFTVLLDPIVTKASFKWKELYLGILSLMGILLIFKFDTNYRIGILVGIASSFLAALFTILNKKLTVNTPAQTMQTFEMVGGFGFLTIVLLMLNKIQGNQFVLPSKQDWAWLLLLAIACTVWANYLMLSSLKQISAFTLNVTLNLEPVYGIILAFILFKEQKELGASFYIGITLIALSVLIQMLTLFKGQKQLNNGVKIPK
jgi:drug/metabolite transporter (DMT)-like permease